MEIGRDALTDSDFNMLWTTLYQEFHTLATREECHASTVYNTIYIICTSSIPYEDKLYWKIGDFLYNRCKEHRIRIEEADDYIKEYSDGFARYDKMLRAMHMLCSFLNGCVKGRKIDEFGYLLWERSVIQSMPKHFFEDLYSYSEERNLSISALLDISSADSGPRQQPPSPGDRLLAPGAAGLSTPYAQQPAADFSNVLAASAGSGELGYLEGGGPGGRPVQQQPVGVRINVLRSFACIVPDTTDPLLYYREKYERLALENIKGKYASIRNVKDVVAFASIVESVVREERGQFDEYFLPESAESLERALAEAFFQDDQTTVKAVKNLIGRNSYFYGLAVLPEGAEPEKFIVSKAEMLASLRKIFEKPNKSLRAITNNNTVCSDVINNLNVLDKGYTLTKSAYAEYIIDTINANMDIFSTDIAAINRLYEVMNLFGSAAIPGQDDSAGASAIAFHGAPGGYAMPADDVAAGAWHTAGDAPASTVGSAAASGDAHDYPHGRTPVHAAIVQAQDGAGVADHQYPSIRTSAHSDYEKILVTIFKYTLQRVKPCFITRLCEYSSELVVATLERGSGASAEATEVFFRMTEVVADRREFMNMYHIALRKRLLARSSCLERERQLLRGLSVPRDDRFYKMIDDVDSNRHGGAGAGSLRNALTLLNSAYWGIETDSGSVPVPDELMDSIIGLYGGAVENGFYKLKEKKIRIIHSFSKVKVLIGETTVILNGYQYAVLSALSRRRNLRELAELREMTGVQENVLKGTLSVLYNEKIIGFNEEEEGFYLRDLRGRRASDISAMARDVEPGMDFCVMSYLEALLSRVLKRLKSAHIKDLSEELFRLSSFELTEELFREAVEAVIEKGVAERANDVLSYSI